MEKINHLRGPLPIVPHNDQYPWLTRNARLLIIKGGFPVNPKDEDFDQWNAYLDDQDEREEKMELEYLDRAKMAGLSTSELLEAVGEPERKAIKAVAKLAKEAIQQMDHEQRPFLSTIAVANMAYFLATGNFEPLAFAYNESFTNGLVKAFERRNRLDLSRALAEALNKVNTVMGFEELDSLRRVAEQSRQAEPEFEL